MNSTDSHRERRRSILFRPASRFAAVAAVMLLSACASGSEAPMQTGPQSGPIDTGTYPNLNVPPEVAAAPITDADKAGIAGRIANAKSRQGSAGRGAGTAGDPARLKLLAARHGDDTLKAIAAQ